MTIRRAWARAKEELFSSDVAPVERRDIIRYAQGMERCLLRLGAFAAQVETVEDFALIKKRPLEEFRVNYGIFLGTLTCMGCGPRAGRCLRKHVLQMGDAVSALCADIEEILVLQNLSKMGTISGKIGKLLELLTQKWTKNTPKSNKEAIQKAVSLKIKELRDAQRELSEALAEGDEDEDLDDFSDSFSEGQINVSGATILLSLFEPFEKLCKSLMESYPDCSVAALEDFLASADKITALFDALATSFLLRMDEGDVEAQENVDKLRVEIWENVRRFVDLCNASFCAQSFLAQLSKLKECYS